MPDEALYRARGRAGPANRPSGSRSRPRRTSAIQSSHSRTAAGSARLYRAGRPVDADANGDSVLAGRERIFVGHIVAHGDRQRLAVCELMPHIAHGTALVPVDARPDFPDHFPLSGFDAGMLGRDDLVDEPADRCFGALRSAAEMNRRREALPFGLDPVQWRRPPGNSGRRSRDGFTIKRGARVFEGEPLALDLEAVVAAVDESVDADALFDVGQRTAAQDRDRDVAPARQPPERRAQARPARRSAGSSTMGASVPSKSKSSKTCGACATRGCRSARHSSAGASSRRTHSGGASSPVGCRFDFMVIRESRT